MNNKEYLQEMHKYVEKSYIEFQQYQSIANEILDVFHELCKKQHISYTIGYGSLIGIVRDHGNIPWDYDIDVIVPITERKKLIDALKSQLPENYYYVYYDNVKNYPTSCLRVCKKGYPFTAIHVDVFFLIGCPDDDKLRRRYMKKISRMSDRRCKKYSSDWFPREKSHFSKILNIVDFIRKKFIPLVLCERESEIYTKYKLGEVKQCCVIGEPYKKVYQYKWFSEYSVVNLQDREVNIPIGYKEILSEIYGDYTTYLPIENRFDEFYLMLKTIRKRNKINKD